MKRLLFWTLVLGAMTALGAQEPTGSSFLIQGSYIVPNQNGLGVSGPFVAPVYGTADNPSPGPGELDSLGSGWGGAELELVYARWWEWALGRGEGLFGLNGVRVQTSAALAPVSLRAEAEATYTPIAFLQLVGGAGAATGWPTPVGNGLGLNVNGVPLTDPFPGVILQAWLGWNFQFDLAAVMPGDWNHVVAVVQHRYRYKHFSAAGPGDPWQFQVDPGENYNGWELLATYLVGYQMPLSPLRTLAVLWNTQGRIDDRAALSPMAAQGWGSDFMEQNLGLVVETVLDENLSLILLPQFRSLRLYSDDSIWAKDFRAREHRGEAWKFQRLAFNLRWTLP